MKAKTLSEWFDVHVDIFVFNKMFLFNLFNKEMISSLHGMVKYKRRVKVNHVKFLLVCSNSSCSRSLISGN